MKFVVEKDVGAAIKANAAEDIDVEVKAGVQGKMQLEVEYK